jgi:two-component system cell cycle sensor histidine kinase/response regulator CckA
MFRDITQQKQAEKALRESEERYRNLCEQSTDAIYITTRERGLLYANQSFLDLFGYTSEEIGAMKVQQMYVNPEDRLTFQQEIEKKESVRDFEVALRKKDGAEMDCLIAATVRRADDGTILGYQGIIRDITERKRMEKALRESEEKYRTILESIEEGCFEVDLGGNLTFCNDALCAISGSSRAELMGMNNREYTSPETAKKMYTFFNKIYRTGKPSKIMDFEIIRKNKVKMVFEMSASLMRDPAGEPIGFRGVVRDITERERAEQEKQKLQSQLQKAQKMEALGTLAGGIAHNFNNLLTGILGKTALTLLDIDPTHPHYERLKSIEKLVESCSKLTKQLLGYARGGRYEITPISLNRVVQETSDTFGTARREITVQRELTEDLWAIKADQGQIEQVLWNLYVNAADAMPKGGHLFLKTTNVTEKDMRGKPYKPKPGDYVLITVSDTGVGMDQNTMDRIFDPFFTTKELGTGTGLGLASVYGIVKAHGGYIDADSREGEGTTFDIYLPASKEELMREETKVPEVMLIGTESILLVDDEDMFLDVGKEVLKKLGYEVFVARSGKAALDIYEENKEKIDLVILDMIMPDMGGGETYDRMKRKNPDLKVLLSSGYNVDGQATQILNRGCDGFIQKPFSIKGLSRQIREVLDKG